MESIQEKGKLILEEERKFAVLLAAEVLNKPTVHFFMILIPIIFVHYFIRFKKFINARSVFVKKYLINREQTLDEAVYVLETGEEPDIEKIANIKNLSKKAQQKLADLSLILFNHYTKLLQSEGTDFHSLVRSAYPYMDDYLSFINQFCKAEKALNKALKPNISEKDQKSVDIVIKTMDSWSEEYRKQSAEKLFNQ